MACKHGRCSFSMLDLDNETAFFGVFDGHGGKVVAKFCAKYLHSQVLKSEAYSSGDLGTAVCRAFFRDCMSSQQVVDFIHEHIFTESSLSAVCERVLDRCLAPSTIGGDGCDNMTMILVQFKMPVNEKKKADVGEQPAKGPEEDEIQ